MHVIGKQSCRIYCRPTIFGGLVHDAAITSELLLEDAAQWKCVPVLVNGWLAKHIVSIVYASANKCVPIRSALTCAWQSTAAVVNLLMMCKPAVTGRALALQMPRHHSKLSVRSCEKLHVAAPYTELHMAFVSCEVVMSTL